MASKQMQGLIEGGKLPVGTRVVRKAYGKVVARATITEDGLRIGKKTFASPSAEGRSSQGEEPQPRRGFGNGTHLGMKPTDAGIRMGSGERGRVWNGKAGNPRGA
jgi:hypothetical protein